jgi:hypothetical protein
MDASISQPQQSLPVWSSVVIWLGAFFSPSAYFVLLLLVSKLHFDVPKRFVLSLFFLIPIVALLICESVVWSCSQTLTRKIGWMIFTLVAMLLQFAIILLIVRTILVTLIGYAQ